MVKRLPERKLDRGAQTTDGYEVRFLTSYNARIAQLIERQPSKLRVAGLSPASRSIDLVVQLVRISACHAEGHEFESRLDRQLQTKYDISRIIYTNNNK